MKRIKKIQEAKANGGKGDTGLLLPNENEEAGIGGEDGEVDVEQEIKKIVAQEANEVKVAEAIKEEKVVA